MSNTAKYMRNCEGKEIDRSDPHWLHPLLRDSRSVQTDPSPIRDWFDRRRPLEERLEVVNAGTLPFKEYFEGLCNTPEAQAQGSFASYATGHGCPEDPDAPSCQVYVRVPMERHEERLPVVYLVGGGALAFSMPEMWCSKMLDFSSHTGCVVVSVRYRPALEACYPAAINDLHAGYEWLHEHADELGIDTDRVVLYGNSSGGHLALALAFRLKRYGYPVRGCVVDAPITDNRMSKTSSRYFITDGDWDGPALGMSAAQYLGTENVLNPLLGPEAFANRASVEECRGLCPVSITTYEMDPDSDYCMEFAAKLKEAGVFVDLHLWAGTTHSAHSGVDENTQRYVAKSERVVRDAIADFFENDCRRPWTAE